jgi:hypothetical protein
VFWKENDMSLADELRAAIRKSEISRYRLWQLTGIQQSHLSRFMKGEVSISLDNAERLADALNQKITIVKQIKKGRQ